MFGGDFGVFLRLSQRDPIQDLVGQNLSAVNNGRISYKYGWSEICVEDAEKHKLCTIYSEKCHQKCHIHVSLVVKCARHPTLMCHIRMVGQSSGTVPAELKFPYPIGWWRLPWKHKKWPYRQVLVPVVGSEYLEESASYHSFRHYDILPAFCVTAPAGL